MNDLASLSATKLIRALKNKDQSSLELLEFYIERYERLNPRINAIVATNFDSARKRASEADAALAKGEVWGPLHGLPMTIKDIIPVVGMPNTYGMPITKDFVPSANVDVVESLLEAGAIIFGKTNLPLMGMDTQSFNEVYGQTNNPWDVTKTPGGSSGGPAAALAAGLTGLEIGNDIGGSIRIPVSYLPATIAPIGFTPEGLPVGVQIIGPYLENHTSIQFAMLLEEQLTGSFKVPPDFE